MTDTATPVPAARPRRRRLSRGLALAATLGAVLAGSNLAPQTAEAAIPRALRPGTRALQFLFGFGPSFGIGGSRYYYGNDFCGNGFCGYGGGWGGRYGGSFKLMQEFNGHFNGTASGPALGILLNEEFSGPYFGFNIAPKFTYDIQPLRDLGLYISPSFSLGYHLTHLRYYGNFNSPSYNYHAANLQFGVAVKLHVNDRFIAFLQLPNFDFNIGPAPGYYNCNAFGRCPAYFVAKVDVMFGAGVSF